MTTSGKQTQATNPPSTVLGRQLGDELRKYRERAGLTTAQVAQALDCTKGKVSRIENGRVPLRSPDLAAMLRLYGMGEDEATLTRLNALARSANKRRREGWWNEHGNVLADTYREFISLEATATRVCTFQCQTVPALLQTPDYARALAVANRSWSKPEEIEQFVTVRVARQQRLTADEPLHVWAVLAEGVLHQQVGGPTTLSEQLRHLEVMAERPNVTIQVIPFRAGAHASMAGPYVILEFPEAGASDVILLDNPSGCVWLEQAHQIAEYRGLWDDARTRALSPVESVAKIRSLTATKE